MKNLLSLIEILILQADFRRKYISRRQKCVCVCSTWLGLQKESWPQRFKRPCCAGCLHLQTRDAQLPGNLHKLDQDSIEHQKVVALAIEDWSQCYKSFRSVAFHYKRHVYKPWWEGHYQVTKLIQINFWFERTFKTYKACLSTSFDLGKLHQSLFHQIALLGSWLCIVVISNRAKVLKP